MHKSQMILKAFIENTISSLNVCKNTKGCLNIASENQQIQSTYATAQNCDNANSNMMNSKTKLQYENNGTQKSQTQMHLKIVKRTRRMQQR